MAAACELIALCLGVIGLVGAAATTGLPMWKVTAFIQENIIVMESRWEGLWMNCYRQANIRMQCKVYDSLLYLPPELQAARGLMCCAVALSFLGLLASFPGLDSTACLQDQPRLKSLILGVAGAMQVVAALCVIIPVSWTAHVIIQDFYNPLLLDAQRRELGEALYIGWVTGAFLFASGVIFLSCRSSSKSALAQLYQPVYTTNSSNVSHAYPFVPTPSSLNSLPQPPLVAGHNLYPQHSSSSTFSPVAVTTAGHQPVFYNPQLVAPNFPVVYSDNMVPNHQPQLSTRNLERLSIHRNSAHASLMSAPWPPGNSGKPYTAVQPTQHTPVLYGYGYSRNEPDSPVSQANSGVYI
ncbi:claudin-8-like [Salminus brasiliensis]|uniref:claudin-8-like n=1 Tax=Salminus brasiliensis TaxID=930266 RepID=UPI003B83129A